MNRIILTRVVLAAVGIAVWGYGQRIDDPNVRWSGIAVLAVSLLLRFAPKGWSGGGPKA
jgi:chromate transport protein ChrA